MADRYDELVVKLLNWSNRDRDVFGNTTAIQDQQLYDFLKYAADKAYRTLRVPPLEKVYRITITEAQVLNKCFGVPADLTEFISITKIGQLQDDGTIRQLVCPVVYNEKVDYRTYRDSLAHHNTANYWTRQRDQILIDDFGLAAGDVFEVYYYGRLSAINSRYPVTAQVYNLNPNLLIMQTTTGDGSQTGEALYLVTTSTTTVAYDTMDQVPDGSTAVTTYFIGEEIPNWLRDENERILLFGALSEAFSYLGEDDMQGKYLQMFQQEIDELNREERMRTASGGNTQIQYSSGLI